MEEEEKHDLRHGTKDRFVPLLTSSLTVSTPNPPAYYEAELIRDGLTYRGKLHRDEGKDEKSNADDSVVTYPLRRFVIHDEAKRHYEGIRFSDGMIAMHVLEEEDTSTYRCLEHLLKFFFPSEKVTVTWLDA